MKDLHVVKINKVGDLVYMVEQTGSFFFTPDTMSFFGDTMSNYGVRELDDSFELYRKKPVKHNTTSSAYFDKTNFKRIIK